MGWVGQATIPRQKYQGGGKGFSSWQAPAHGDLSRNYDTGKTGKGPMEGLTGACRVVAEREGG